MKLNEAPYLLVPLFFSVIKAAAVMTCFIFLKSSGVAHIKF